ncbi:Alpha/beta hydrolase domain-containing protein 11 [Orchesella cincta]|uniref:Alpha/beta hydrolase domain-containing protein 11 n=1 Tax=Orchesella cincta TaxID=48709 RepID=A0A1D2MH95_ORCCI|nr:Alpha/beta hydrolase domain-containing protein 11 [Orchesella cincta]
MKVYLQALYDIGLNLKDTLIPLSEARKLADASLKAVVHEPAVRAFLLTNLAERDGTIVWKPNLEVLIRNFAEIGNFPKVLLSKTFDKPTLFIKGEKSQYIPDSVFPEIQKTFTNAQLSTVQNAGHWPHAENTVRFMEILLPFVRT